MLMYSSRSYFRSPSVLSNIARIHVCLIALAITHFLVYPNNQTSITDYDKQKFHSTDINIIDPDFKRHPSRELINRDCGCDC